MDAQELKAVCQRVATRNRSTAEEKEILTAAANEYGISINKKCAMCYVDAAVEIYRRLKVLEGVEKLESDPREYILKNGVDVIFAGIRINNTTLTDTLAEVIVGRGFSLSFFKKHPQQ